MVKLSISVFIIFSVIFCNLAWSGTKSAAEFQKSLLNSKENRFQAINLTATSVFIIDSKEGHLWIFGASPQSTWLQYVGRLKPGEKFMDYVYFPKPKQFQTQQ